MQIKMLCLKMMRDLLQALLDAKIFPMMDFHTKDIVDGI